MEGLISFALLKKWLGYENKAAVVRWLNDKGISYEIGRNGEPITTKEAINKRLLGEQADEQEFEFEM
ncbi:DUF4224 domain-containing protein [Thiomicrorhabdus sp.]|uniref:DUF4224 domain-containing protein n=1 Tax=Thiomicrorhabdus sp. TaxID=2039724 RepID=UPI0029C76930|nr:DUF4224 domain-containing protein [Thiomicrorhabdus sp.]